MNSKSFTLIELLVVISILGLLSSLVLVGLRGAKDQAEIGKAQEFSHTVRVTLGADLVGEWRLDDETDPTKDSSGYGHDGTLVNAPQWNDGIFDRALEFDGTNYIDTGVVASDLGIDGATSKTVSVWAYTKGFNNGGIFECGTQLAGEDFSLRTRTADDQWRVQFWSTPDFDFTYDSRDKWVHFVLVHNGIRGIVYANAVEIASENSTLNTTDTKTFKIGRWASANFIGIIDEVQIYNKALTIAEVQQLYVQGAIKYKMGYEF